MGDIFVQNSLPGLGDKTSEIPMDKPDEKDDVENPNIPFVQQEEKPTDPIVLDRRDPGVIDFTTEARIQLYYYLEEIAKENGNLDSFHRKVGDVNNFVAINQPYPIADITDSEGKKKDPYYTNPRQYSKGLKTYTEEIVNTGNGYNWEVTRIQTKAQGGEDRISWRFRNISNPKSD